MGLELSADNTRKGSFELLCIVYDEDGAIINAGKLEANLSLNPKQFDEAMQKGLRLHQQVSAPDKNPAYIRIAIHDKSSDRVGAIEVATASLNPPKP